jgi:pyruvate dehydrogenase E1 component beta subunit
VKYRFENGTSYGLRCDYCISEKTNRLVVLEERPFASVASEITYIVQERAFDFLDAPIQRITTADTPAPYSPVLLKEWLPNADVIKAVKVMYK